MCGITGFLSASPTTAAPELEAQVTRMSSALAHRGPDQSGAWVDAPGGIALGFRRLAILDLSPSGHQPMHSASGRYTIVFNGEVYNFKELRAELERRGTRFKGGSDTEVMLAGIEAWGLKPALQRFNGMFALALWDQQTRTLTLARDRVGIKPLYYGVLNGTLLFGSELKALRAHPAFRAEINRNALSLYLRHNCIPAPYSIYQGIHKLPPASLLSIHAADLPNLPQTETYWQLDEIVHNGLAAPLTGSDAEITALFHEHLLTSIGARMVADVPLGAFLSGGIDSSLVVALMQAQNARPVQTFTIGFQESGFNEATYAKEVATLLGTNHTELYITPTEALAVIPTLPTIYDEPFADSSQIPTYLVSQLARRDVTVSLSGDGGDELFGGYNRYFWTERIWRRVGWLPLNLRNALSALLTRLPARAWTSLMNPLHLPNPANKIHTLAEMLAAPNADALYLHLISHWQDPAQLVINGHEPLTPVTDHTHWAHALSQPQNMMALDMATYLHDDILTKVDRASMATSLEVRAPFLDNHETLALAWQLPVAHKIRNGRGKWILRSILSEYLPAALFERPKMGFGVPVDSWLRGPLRGWAEDLLDEKRLRAEGFFHPAPIRAKWAEHISGQRNWQYDLWDVLTFQAWYQAQSRERP